MAPTAPPTRPAPSSMPPQSPGAGARGAIPAARWRTTTPTPTSAPSGTSSSPAPPTPTSSTSTSSCSLAACRVSELVQVPEKRNSRSGDSQGCPPVAHTCGGKPRVKTDIGPRDILSDDVRTKPDRDASVRDGRSRRGAGRFPLSRTAAGDVDLPQGRGGPRGDDGSAP